MTTSAPLRKVIPLRRWPAPDQAAWAAALVEGALFEPAGAGAHLSAGSRKSIASGYGRFIGYLTACAPEPLLLAPAERVTPEQMTAFIEHLRGTVLPSGLFNYVKHLYDAIRIMAPDRDWSWLKTLAWRLARDVHPQAKSDRIVSSDRLLWFGIELMDTAFEQENARQQLIQYRDGLIIAVLAARTLRRRNLAATDVARNLRRSGASYRLLFSAEETKTHRAIDMPMPKVLEPYIDRYVGEIRPGFPGADRHSGLWVSMKGQPMGEQAIYQMVCDRTRHAFGKPINLHLFRDCATTTVAIRDPANILVARDLLGHSDLRTTQRFYNQAGQLQAVRAFQATLEGIRQELPVPATTAGRRRRGRR